MAIRRDGAWVKQQRIRKMHNMLKGAGDVPLARFLAACSYQMGLSRSTAMKYLQDLVAIDLIEVDEEADLVREVVLETPLPESEPNEAEEEK